MMGTLMNAEPFFVCVFFLAAGSATGLCYFYADPSFIRNVPASVKRNGG